MNRAVAILALLIGLVNAAEAATLKLKIVDTARNPVRGVIVAVVESITRTPYGGSTDEQGALSQTVPAGTYAISAGGTNSDVLLVKIEATEQRELVLELSPAGLIAVSSVVSMQAPVSPEADPSLDPIREYQVQQDPGEPGAQQVSSLADIVNPFPAQKGGRFHGSIYEFHRNDNLDARNFFDPLGQPLPEYKRNQFGITLSFALKPTVNILGTFEGLRIIQGSTLLSHIPTPQAKQGDFSAVGFELKDPATGAQFPGNRIPASRIAPVSKQLLSLIPDPNREDPDRNYVNSKPVVRDRNTWTFRVDQQLSGGSNYVGRYWMSNATDVNVYPLPAFGSGRNGRDQEASFSYNHKFTSRLLGNVRLGFARNTSALESVNAGKAGLLESLGIEGLGPVAPEEEGYPDFRISGYTSFGDAGLPLMATMNRFDFEGGLTISPENHSFRVGAGLSHYQVNNNRSDGLCRGRFSFNGYYTGDAFADFLLGLPDTASRGIGSDRADLRRRTWYFYAQDDWKLGPRLSVSWGLTYNYFQPFRSIRDNVSAFYPLTVEPPLDGHLVVIGSDEARSVGLDRAGAGGVVFPDRNDLAPSFGVAFRPLGSNRLIVRGGYSLGYSPLGRDYFVGYLGRNYPFYYIQTAQSPIDQPSIDLGHPFDAAVATELTVRGIEPELRTAYLHYWSIGTQYEIFRQWNLEGWYQGSKAVHMARVQAGNIPLPGTGDIQPRRPNPGYGRFNYVTGSGAYTSNSLDLALERRLSNGLSVKSGFNWNSSIGDVYYGNPSNPRNLAAERAGSYYPARQFFFNYILDLPFGKSGRFGRELGGLAQPLISGWRLSGITQFMEGYRFSVYSSGDPNNDGVSDDRPDRLGSGAISDPSIDGWLAVSDFAAPAPFTYGNSGRNILTGPAFVNWDLSVIKQTRFGDGDLIELRVELFNAFNQVNFENPNAVYGTSVFGKIFGAHRAREIELALRYSF